MVINCLPNTGHCALTCHCLVKTNSCETVTPPLMARCARPSGEWHCGAFREKDCFLLRSEAAAEDLRAWNICYSLVSRLLFKAQEDCQCRQVNRATICLFSVVSIIHLSSGQMGPHQEHPLQRMPGQDVRLPPERRVRGQRGRCPFWTCHDTLIIRMSSASWCSCTFAGRGVVLRIKLRTLGLVSKHSTTS